MAGSRSNQPSPRPRPRDDALWWTGFTSACASARSQTTASTTSVATAIPKRAAASPQLPSATAAGTAHTAPSGVHASTSAICSTVSAVNADPDVTLPSTGPTTRITGSTATAAMTSRNRRPDTRRAAADVVAREPMTHVASATTEQTIPATSAAGVRHHSPVIDSTAPTVTSPGTPMIPVSARPVSSERRGMANVTNRAGSMVESSPNAISGTTHQPSTSSDPTSTATSPRMSGSCTLRTAMEPTRTTSASSPYRMPMASPTTCHGLRRNELRRSVSFRLDEVRNHARPSPLTRPPTRSTNRSSRLPSPRTSSTVPAAST